MTVERVSEALDRLELAIQRLDRSRGGAVLVASRLSKLKLSAASTVAQLDELLAPPADG